MVRTISVDLQNAQVAEYRLPFVDASFNDRPPTLPRFTWAPVYTGGEDRVCDAAVFGAGSIVRAMVGGDGGIYVDLVADPSVPGDWYGAWRQLVAPAGVYAAAGLAVQATPGSNTIRVYYVDNTQLSLKAVRSDDGGLTWPATENLYTYALGSIRAVAADGNLGDTSVVYGYYPTGAEPCDYLIVQTYSGGAWGPLQVDGALRYDTIASLGVCRTAANQLQIVVCSGATGQLGGRTYDLGSVSFTGSYDLLTPGSGMGFTYSAPKIAAPASSGGSADGRYFYLAFESDASVDARYYLWATSDLGWLGEGVPLSIAGTQGVRLLQVGGYWYLVGSGCAYKSAVYGPSAGENVEVSSRVRMLEITEREDGSRLVLELENSDGGLLNAGVVGGSNQALRELSRLQLAIGLMTGPSSSSYAWHAPWWVEDVALFDDLESGVASVEVTCIDCWEYLDRVKVRRQVSFANVTLWEVLRRALWPVCDIGASGPWAQLGTVVTAFVFQPGESYGAIAKKVLAMAGMGLGFGTVPGTPSGWGSVQINGWVDGAGVSAHDYGDRFYPVKRGSYGRTALLGNGEYVNGSSAAAVEADFAHIALNGVALWERVFEKHLDTLAKVQARGTAALATAERERRSCWIEMPADVSLEIGDGATMHYANSGYSVAEVMIARAIRTTLEMGKNVFEQRVEFTGD